jgi:hypothetical protein
MGRQYLKVVFPDERQVFIGGRVAGETNRRLVVEEGTHYIRLAPPRNYSPRYRRPTVTGTTPRRPMEVVFEKKSLDVFISYSHQDRKWLKMLREFLSPLVQNRQIEIWDDTMIKPGTLWSTALEKALVSTKVAVLLVSRHFLASDFIVGNELPRLLAVAEEGGLQILWIYVSESLYEETDIEQYQAAHDVSKPLDALSPPAKRHRVLKQICQNIKHALEEDPPSS